MAFAKSHQHLVLVICSAAAGRVALHLVALFPPPPPADRKTNGWAKVKLKTNPTIIGRDSPVEVMSLPSRNHASEVVGRRKKKQKKKNISERVQASRRSLS